MRTFDSSIFNYCLLAWMFCDRTLSSKVNHVHERALRIVHKDCKNDFGSLLGQSNAISIHVRNQQLIMMEIFKAYFDLNPTFMKDTFIERSITYNLRHSNGTQLPKVRTASFGVATLPYLGNKLWNYLPHDTK